VSGSLNSTLLLLHLFQKVLSLRILMNIYIYRHISLYNLVYKIITKLISNKIKPKLVEVMSKEQFGFLANRKIVDAIGITQECLHSIKTNHLETLILKLDLV